MNKYTKYDSEIERKLYCKCGNKAYFDGFFPCDEQGNELYSSHIKSWNGLYLCGACGEIIDARQI